MMKHPLTSKERRGLAAVAAAALLCIAAGPLLRACGGKGSRGDAKATEKTETLAPDSVDGALTKKSEKAGKSEEMSETSTRSKKSGKSKKVKQKKMIPERSPLDEECD